MVHFSGHATAEGLCVEAADGLTHVISNEALAQAFRVLGDSVRVVVLNACFTEETAAVLGRHVDCVVGMQGRVEDSAALAFSKGFYGALADGSSVQDAYLSGQVAVAAQRGTEHPSRIQVRDATPIVLAADGPPVDGGPRSLRRPLVFAGSTLGGRLVELLQTVPGASSFDVRTQLIPRLSRVGGGPVALERDRPSARIDLELIVAQLENLGLPLVEDMLHDCASRVADAELARRLADAARQVRSYIEGRPPALRPEPVAEGGSVFSLSVPYLLPSLPMPLDQRREGDHALPNMLPLDQLYEGSNASPAIRWWNAPAGTQSFVVLMEELECRLGEPKYYWVQHSIPGDVTELPRDAGAVDRTWLGTGVPAQSDAEQVGVPGYHGPRATTVDRRYQLRVLALSRNDVPDHPLLDGAALLAWVEARHCLLAEATCEVRSRSPFSNRDFLFDGHPVLGRIFGASFSTVFVGFFLLAIGLLVLPAWALGIGDLPATGWVPPSGAYPGPPPADNRGFFHQPNWWPIYVLAVPWVFASAARLATQIRRAVQRLARRPGGVIVGSPARPFAVFFQAEMARSAGATRWAASAAATIIVGVDVGPLVVAFVTGDFSAIRPYWAIAHLHAKRIDLALVVAFDVIAYLFEAMFTGLFAFITFKLLAFLRILSRTVRGYRSEAGYVFAPHWHDPWRRLGLAPLAGLYNAFIVLALAVTMFAFLHRLQQMSEVAPGWPGYLSDLARLFDGEGGQLWALGRWSTVTSGFMAMLVALVLPMGVIAYFPLYRLRRFVEAEIVGENDAHPQKLRLAKTSEERAELVARHEALATVNVWPNGDTTAYATLSIWAVLFGSAIYPPLVLPGAGTLLAGGVLTLVRRAAFPRAVA